MWHVSVASTTRPTITLFGKAERLLLRVGDSDLGQWVNVVEESKYAPGKSVVHIRRRLTDEEAELVGPVRDIRGTPEMDRRLEAAAKFLHCRVEDIYRLEPSLQLGKTTGLQGSLKI